MKLWKLRDCVQVSLLLNELMNEPDKISQSKVWLPLYLVLLFFNSSLCAEVLSLKPAELEGHLVQGGLVIGKTTPGNKVFFNSQSIHVSPQGIFLIGFHRDEPQQVSLKITSVNNIELINTTLNIKKRSYQIQHINGLPPAKVSPQKAELLTRIKKEQQLARQARMRDDERTDFMTPFIWPTIGPISGVYGSQRILNGQPKWPHYGVDIAVPTGTSVQAPAGGIVTLAHPDMFYSGGTLIVDHGHGLSSAFLHLSKLLVQKGDVVKQGDIIAQVGATGRATGAHLDWRMNLFNRRIDPQLLVPPMAEVLANTPDFIQTQNVQDK